MDIFELYFKQTATKKEKIIKFFYDLINHELVCLIFLFSIVSSFFSGLITFIRFISHEDFSNDFFAFKISFILFIILSLSYYCFDVKFKEYLFLRNKHYLNFLQSILLSKFNFDLKKQMDIVVKDVEKIDIILNFLKENLKNQNYYIYLSTRKIEIFDKIYSFETLKSIVENKKILIESLSEIQVKTMETEIVESSNVLKQKVEDLKHKEELKKFSNLLD